jgi:hypothetical protein
MLRRPVTPRWDDGSKTEARNGERNMRVEQDLEAEIAYLHGRVQELEGELAQAQAAIAAAMGALSVASL